MEAVHGPDCSAHGGGRGEGAGFDRLLGSLFVHTIHVETLGDRGAVHLDETMSECSWCSEGCEAVQWRRCSGAGVVRWRLRVGAVEAVQLCSGWVLVVRWRLT